MQSRLVYADFFSPVWPDSRLWPANMFQQKKRSADVLSGRHIVRCFLDILSGPSSDILSGLLGSAPDILSGRLRIRHIVRRTFCQDWMDLHQTNCQDVYVDQSIFLVYWPYFWYVYDQISQFRPNFTISTKFHNFDQNGPKMTQNSQK